MGVILGNFSRNMDYVLSSKHGICYHPPFFRYCLGFCLGFIHCFPRKPTFSNALRTVAALKYSTDRDGANGYRIPFKLLGLCLLEWAMPLYDKVINTSILLVILNHTALVIF